MRCVLIAVERVSGYACMAVLPEPTAEQTARVLVQMLAPYQVLSLTFDNGVEFAQYAQACQQLNAQAYLAEPARPQQRGTCETPTDWFDSTCLNSPAWHASPAQDFGGFKTGLTTGLASDMAS